MDGRRARVVEQVRQHRGDDPRAVGLAEAHAEAAADDHRLDVEQVDGRGDPGAERQRRRGRSACVASLSPCSSARSQMPLVRRSRPCSAASSKRCVLRAARVRGGGRAPPSPRGRRRPRGSRGARRGSGGRPRGRPCGRSRRRRRGRATACRRGSGRRRRRCPRRRRAASCRARRRRARTRPSSRRRRRCRARPACRARTAARGRAGSSPASRAGCRRATPCPRAVSTVPGEPTPTPRSCDGSSEAAFAASVSAAAIAFATSAGPPVVGVGWRALPSTLVCGVGDDRLDLGAAEVDAADRAGGADAGRRWVGHGDSQVTSSRIVTGPSPTSSTSMCAPKRPRAAPSRSQKRS